VLLDVWEEEFVELWLVEWLPDELEPLGPARAKAGRSRAISARFRITG